LPRSTRPFLYSIRPPLCSSRRGRLANGLVRPRLARPRLARPARPKRPHPNQSIRSQRVQAPSEGAALWVGGRPQDSLPTRDGPRLHAWRQQHWTASSMGRLAAMVAPRGSPHPAVAAAAVTSAMERRIGRATMRSPFGGVIGRTVSQAQMRLRLETAHIAQRHPMGRVNLREARRNYPPNLLNSRPSALPIRDSGSFHVASCGPS